MMDLEREGRAVAWSTTVTMLALLIALGVSFYLSSLPMTALCIVASFVLIWRRW